MTAEHPPWPEGENLRLRADIDGLRPSGGSFHFADGIARSLFPAIGVKVEITGLTDRFGGVEGDVAVWIGLPEKPVGTFRVILTDARRRLDLVQALAKRLPEERHWDDIVTFAAENAVEAFRAKRLRPGEGGIDLERIGPSYRVTANPPGLVIVLRDVRTDGELTADVSVALGERHLYRTTCTLSLTARDRLARTAADFGGIDLASVRGPLFAAIEAVLEAEEALGGALDLRTSSLTGNGSMYVTKPLWESGSAMLVAPGDAGKSTISRAIAVSVTSGLTVIPGIVPAVIGPILYVPGEDAVAIWHTRPIEAICRGLGVDRSSLAYPVLFYDASGKPIHRIARAIAERAADVVGVILDPVSAFLAAGDQVRDRDNLFWRAIDTIGKPVLLNAHPNLAQARQWTEADGRIAGSELNRDRVRLAWAAHWQDEPAVVGTSYRRYTLINTKRNHGPALPPLGFAVSWEFGLDEEPGVVRFMPSEPFRATNATGRALTAKEQATIDAYRAGARTPGALGAALGIEPNTAKGRLHRAKEQGLLSFEEESA